MTSSNGGMNGGISGGMSGAMGGSTSMDRGMSGGGSMSVSSGMASSNGALEENENNNVFEPAQVINERSNSQVVNGTESDELTISGSFTQAPTLLNNATSSGR